MSSDSHQPPDFYSLIQRIDLLLSLRRPAEAEKTARELIALHPDQGEGYSHLSRCLVVLGRNREAIDAAKEGRSKNPRDAWTHYVLAFIQLAAKRNRAAQTSAFDALTINPYYSDARHVLVQSYLEEKQFPEAENAIREGLSHDPLHHDLLLARVRMAYDRKRFVEAIESAREALFHYPESHQLHCYLGISKWSIARRYNLRGALRDHREAGVHLTEACRLNPSDAIYVDNVIQNAVAARKLVYGLPVIIYVWAHLVICLCPFLKFLLIALAIMGLAGQKVDIPAVPNGFILSAPFPKQWFPPTPPDKRERLWVWAWRGLIAFAGIELLTVTGLIIASAMGKL